MSLKTGIEFDSEWNKIKRDIESLARNKSKIEAKFIDIAAHGIIQVLRKNTPEDSGELRDSWQIFEKGKDYIVVGTNLTDKLSLVLNGAQPRTIRAKSAKAMHFFIGGEEFFRSEIQTSGSVPNEFIKPLQKAMDEMLELLILSLLKKHWKIVKDMPAKNITKVNLSKTVGLTGTKRNARRGRGGGIQKAKTGRKQFKRTLSRRRRTGKFITSKNTSVG